MNYKSFFPILFLLGSVALLTGCSGSKVVSVTKDENAYLLYDQKNLEHVSVYQMKEKFWAPGMTSIGTTLLIPNGEIPSKESARKIEELLAPSRKISTRFDVVDLGIIPGLMANSREEINANSSPVKWIISTDPLVIALGANIETPPQLDAGGVGGYFWNGQARVRGNLRFASSSDLDMQVTGLLILAHWPERTSASHPDNHDALREEIHRNLRRVPLPRNTTLKSVLDTPSIWLRNRES